jgi:Kef-type K+ transport system membrane component KefB
MNLHQGTVLAALIFVAGLLSVELGLSAAILEIGLGVVAGNFLGIEQTEWVKYTAALGGMLLTFMAGAEVDPRVLRQRAKESFSIGALSFVAPFLGVAFLCRYPLGWEWQAARLAGIALSTTSLAVVYAVLVETGLARTEIGKIIMAATFVTDFGTAAGLTLLFAKPQIQTLWFAIASIAIVALVPRAAPWFFRRYGNRVIEPEIKLLFLLLLALMYLAHAGDSHAILPAFLLGLMMSPIFHGNPELQRKLRVVAFAFITPIFFLNGGLNISLPLLWANLGVFLLLLVVKLGTKAVGVFPVSRIFLPREATYTTLLMSTGLTMGTISSVFGYQAGIIDQAQFSVLVAAVVTSAIVPTALAQRFFHPRHLLEAVGGEVEPDLLDAGFANATRPTDRKGG